MTRDEFILKSRILHGDLYDYSKVEYLNNRTDVTIICKDHAEFKQKPHNHLSSKGCPTCSGNIKMTKDYFIEKSNIVHENKYIYSEANFIDSKTQIDIICPVHGIFNQSPKYHIRGSGCKKCGGSQKSTTLEFIEKSNRVHNFKYEYSKVIYKNNKSKIKVTCLDHGDFEIIPTNHLKGIGCSKCSNKNIPTTLEFIDKSNNVHNFKYSYDKTYYLNCKTKIIITCKDHGDYDQTPNEHLSGRGCSKCNVSKGEKYIEEYLISNSIEYKTQFIFEDLKYKKHLRFDFCIFDNGGNIKFLIEYNGAQHYFFSGQYGMKRSDFDKSVERDNLKMNYCINKKIDIHIIKYNEDIDFRLGEIFSI